MASPPPDDKDIPLKLIDCKRYFNIPRRQLKLAQLETMKNELIACCLTHVQDSYRVHLNRLQGLKIIESIITRTKLSNVSSELAVHMTWAILSCIHHFLLRLKATHGFLQWLRRRQARKCVQTYDKLLSFLLPEFYSLVLNASISFYEEANIWDVEYMCSNMLQRLLLRSEDRKSDSIIEILSKYTVVSIIYSMKCLALVENNTLTNTATSRQILHVLYDVEDSLGWSLMDARILERFLDMHYRSVTPENNEEYNYSLLEKGLDKCLRAMTQTFEEPDLTFTVLSSYC